MKKLLTAVLILSLLLANMPVAHANTPSMREFWWHFPESQVIIPNRHITTQELYTWLEEYYEQGGRNSFESEVVRLMNIERQAVGAPPLRVNTDLMRASRFKAQSMANINYFNHDGVHGTPGDLANIFANFEGSGITENLAMGPNSPERVVNGWMNSPYGHREAILDPLNLTVGVGVYLQYEGQATVPIGDGVYLPGGSSNIFWAAMFTSNTGCTHQEPSITRPNFVRLSREARAMQQMIQRTMGRRPFSMYDVAFNHWIVQQVNLTDEVRRVCSHYRPAISGVTSGPMIGTGERRCDYITLTELEDAYYHALYDMLFGQAGIFYEFDAREQRLNNFWHPIAGFIIGLIPYAGGAIKESLGFANQMVELGVVDQIGEEAFQNIGTLLTLHDNTTDEALQRAIERVLAAHYPQEIDVMHEVINRALGVATTEVVSAAVKLKFAWLPALYKALEATHSIASAPSRTRGNAAERIFALQGIREAVWQQYDIIVQDVLNNNIPTGELEDALLQAYYLFALSSYLAEEQLWWLRPVLDSRNWGAASFFTTSNRWDVHPYIQKELREIVAMRANPVLYPFSLVAHESLSGQYSSGTHAVVNIVNGEVELSLVVSTYTFWLNGSFEHRTITTTNTPSGRTVTDETDFGTYRLVPEDTTTDRALLNFEGRRSNEIITRNNRTNTIHDDILGRHDYRPNSTLLLEINSPVDFEIVNRQGVVVAQVINNIPIENEHDHGNVIVAVEGGTKYALILQDNGYTINFTGTGDGVMRYAITEINQLTGVTLSTSEFTNVSLTTGRQLTSVPTTVTGNTHLFLVENNSFVGEVANDGTETRFDTVQETVPEPTPTPTPPPITEPAPPTPTPTPQPPIIPTPSPVVTPTPQPPVITTPTPQPPIIPTPSPIPTPLPTPIPTPTPVDDFRLIELRFTMDSSIYLHNGEQRVADADIFIDPEYHRVMIPLRLVAEAFDANVDWVAESRMAIISHFTGALFLHVDSSLPMDMGRPRIRNNRTFVPLRYVSVALGLNVYWDDTHRAAYITN